MNYSIKNPAYGRMMTQAYDARVNDEARLANELQRSFPGMTRTEALREASRLIDKHGLGLTVAGHEAQAWSIRLYRRIATLDHYQSRRIAAGPRLARSLRR